MNLMVEIRNERGAKKAARQVRLPGTVPGYAQRSVTLNMETARLLL